jgi:MFS family permease
MSPTPSVSGVEPTPTLVTLLRVYIPFALAYVLSYLFRSVNSVIFPSLEGDIPGLSAGDLGFLTSMYFLFFTAVQIPLGVMLDRYGPRRVQSGLILFAALGCIVFGAAASVAGLAIGRALIGLGVAGGLMAAIKAITIWYPPQRWSLMIGLHMAAGGLGSIAATHPVEAALGLAGWRHLFFGLGALTVAISATLFFVVPERRAATVEPAPIGAQIQVVGRIMRDGYFWRLTPLVALQQASLFAFQALWAGPWLRDVVGLDRAAATGQLFWMAVGMTFGFVTTGWGAGALAQRGVPYIVSANAAAVLFLAVNASLAFTGLWRGAPAPLVTALMLGFGFLGTIAIIYFTPLQQAFPIELSGRATTSMNFIIFPAVLAAQWGQGQILDLWPKTATGYAPEGYAVTQLVFVALQIAALLWILLSPARPSIERPAARHA